MKIITAPRQNLEKQASEIIEKEITILLNKQPFLVLGIVGGTSVSAILKNLRNKQISWNKIHFFMIDERRVPIKNNKSNFKLANDSLFEYLLKTKKINPRNIHPYDYTKQIGNYKSELKEYGGKFDIILLSSGEDSHVAGLFPNLTIKNKEENFIVFDNSPKPPKKIMSASRKLLEKSQVALLLFFGEGKQKAFKNFKRKNLLTNQCPTKLVNKISKSYILTDIPF